MAFHQPFQVIGFHSCDKKIGLDVLNGRYGLIKSINSWDWLGSGVYFWEQNPYRALQYAKDCAGGKQKNNGRITTPFVIGAIIELGHCLNLIEPNSIGIVKKSYNYLKELFKVTGDKMPVNRGPNRALDCSVIEFIHEINKEEGLPGYDIIRSPFHEDDAIYPDSNFTENLHIEICVRDTGRIKGYFLPQPIDLYNPYLHKPFRKKRQIRKSE